MDYKALHTSLADQYQTTPDVILYIRRAVLNLNWTKEEMMEHNIKKLHRISREIFHTKAEYEVHESSVHPPSVERQVHRMTNIKRQLNKGKWREELIKFLNRIDTVVWSDIIAQRPL